MCFSLMLQVKHTKAESVKHQIWSARKPPHAFIFYTMSIALESRLKINSTNQNSSKMEEEEDRISQLPDPILEQILSSIDIKLAVQTSILSTRWKSLWLSLSDLHFHHAADSQINLNNRQSAQAFSLQFSHFVSHFLSHRDQATTLRTFHLSLDARFIHANANPFIEKCALYAVNHGVETLHIHALCHSALHLPAAFFISKTLRELKLSQFNYGLYIPKKFSLPHLKILFLENCDLIDEEYHTPPEEPFSGLPELQELTIRGRGLQGVVFAPKLRFLEICHDRLTYSAAMKEISCPMLTSFRYEGYYPLDCSRINLPTLEEVYLNIYKKLGSRNNRSFNKKRITLNCVRMLQQLGNATIVTLTLDTVKVLEMDRGLIEQSPSPFPYIKCLRLRKGRREIPTVEESVMNYLKGGSLFCDSLRVEIPGGVSIENSEDLFDIDRDELQLQRLFGIEDDQTSS